MQLQKETIILVPNIVKQKALELAKHKLYYAALKLLEENKIEVDIYEEKIIIKEKANKKGEIIKMPIYEYECSEGHVTELIKRLSESEALSTTCNKCSRLAVRIPSLTGRIQIAKPTRIFRNPRTGETMVAASDYDSPPKGYITEELKGPIERSKFEKEQQRKIDATNALVSAQLESQKDATRKNRHEDIKANMSKLAAESDNPTGAKHLINAALNRSKRKKFRERKSEVKLAVNHTNASNLSEAK